MTSREYERVSSGLQAHFQPVLCKQKSFYPCSFAFKKPDEMPTQTRQRYFGDFHTSTDCLSTLMRFRAIPERPYLYVVALCLNATGAWNHISNVFRWCKHLMMQDLELDPETVRDRWSSPMTLVDRTKTLIISESYPSFFAYLPQTASLRPMFLFASALPWCQGGTLEACQVLREFWRDAHCTRQHS